MAVRMVPVVALLAVPLAGCSALDTINPFGAGEKYETKILAETPATDIYDQGLARLQKKDGAGAAKKFAELDKQYPFSDWSRKGLMMQTYANYQAGDYDTAITTGKHFYQLYPNAPDAPYALYLQGDVLLPADPRRIARPGERRQGARPLPADRDQVPVVGICRRFQVQDPGDARSAGRQGDVDRAVLPEPAQLHGRHQPLPRGAGEVPDDAAHRGSAGTASPRPISPSASPARPRPRRPCSATISPDSPWYKDAFAKLQADGLEPNEDPTSWISRTYHKVVG